VGFQLHEVHSPTYQPQSIIGPLPDLLTIITLGVAMDYFDDGFYDAVGYLVKRDTKHSNFIN
jgi:hypothetical protein